MEKFDAKLAGDSNEWNSASLLVKPLAIRNDQSDFYGEAENSGESIQFAQ